MADLAAATVTTVFLIYHRAMRCVVVLVVLVVALGACEFHAEPATGGTSPPPVDAGPDDAASAVPPADATADAPPTRFCDPDDAHLVACYELEGDARDGSRHHLDAQTDHVSFHAGEVGMAMQFDVDSAADVTNRPELDIAALTIEAWIRPSKLPSNGALAYILDVNNQYALRLESSGDLHCVLIGAQSAMADAHLAVDQWAHVACTYDSAHGAAIYVAGQRIATGSPGGALATNGTDGLSLAADNQPAGTGPLDPQPPDTRSRLHGLIDQVRLLDIARTPAQICADAERSSCP